jgi:hypothetical protein
MKIKTKKTTPSVVLTPTAPMISGGCRGSRRESAVAFQIIHKNWPIRSVHPSDAW